MLFRNFLLCKACSFLCNGRFGALNVITKSTMHSIVSLSDKWEVGTAFSKNNQSFVAKDDFRYGYNGNKSFDWQNVKGSLLLLSVLLLFYFAYRGPVVLP